jgi:hypothetical protein
MSTSSQQGESKAPSKAAASEGSTAIPDISDMLAALKLTDPGAAAYRYLVTYQLNDFVLDNSDYNFLMPSVGSAISQISIVEFDVPLDVAVTAILERGAKELDTLLKIAPTSRTTDGQSLSDYWRKNFSIESSESVEIDFEAVSNSDEGKIHRGGPTGDGWSTIELSPMTGIITGSPSVGDQAYAITIFIRNQMEKSLSLLTFSIVRKA